MLSLQNTKKILFEYYIVQNMKVSATSLVGVALATSSQTIAQCGTDLSDNDRATCQVRTITRIAYDLIYFVRPRGGISIKKHGHLHPALPIRLVEPLRMIPVPTHVWTRTSAKAIITRQC